jgi:hypothetical protein
MANLGHVHKFVWNDREAYDLCRCGAREAICGYCRKHLNRPTTTRVVGGYIVHDLSYCSDECRKKNTERDRKLNAGPSRIFEGMGW